MVQRHDMLQRMGRGPLLCRPYPCLPVPRLHITSLSVVYRAPCRQYVEVLEKENQDIKRRLAAVDGREPRPSDASENTASTLHRSNSMSNAGILKGGTCHPPTVSSNCRAEWNGAGGAIG